MLVLTRLVGESILIGDDVRVKVVRVADSESGFRVRLAIEAPRSVQIDRKEVRARKAAKAADSGP